jgi:hypothetical protein
MIALNDYTWALTRAREVLKNIETDLVVNGIGFEIALVIKIGKMQVVITLRSSKNGKDVYDMSMLNDEVRMKWLDTQLQQVSKMIEE